MIKLPYQTEIATICGLAGGAIQAYVLIVSTPNEPLTQLSGISAALLSVAISLGFYRGSKKLTEILKEK
jgi:hypothetical protein